MRWWRSKADRAVNDTDLRRRRGIRRSEVSPTGDRSGRSSSVWIIVALVATACSNSDTEPTVSSTAPTTTTAQRSEPTTTLTTAASTTSTTVALEPPASDWTLADAASPVDAFDSFRFQSRLLDVFDERSATGIATGGVAVGPEAVQCTLGNPAYVSPVLGEATAIGEQYWFGDDFVRSGPNDRQSGGETLRLCPGASEFWEGAFFLQEPFQANYIGPGEEVAGLPTSVFALSADDPSVVVDQGSVWVAGGGVPLKVELAGTVDGGVGRWADSSVQWMISSEPASGVVAFEFQLELSDVEGTALMVRSPDGTEVAGPIGPIEVSIAQPPPLSAALAAEVDLAQDTPCFGWPTFSSDSRRSELSVNYLTGTALATAFDELELGTVFVKSQNPDLGSITVANPGMAEGGWPTSPVVTGAEGSVARTHAYLLFNHRAPLLAFLEWAGFRPSNWFGDGPRLAVLEQGSVSESSQIARFDGNTLEFMGSEEDITFWHFLAFPMFEHQPADAAVKEARDRLEDWKADVERILPGLEEGDLQAAADLQFLFDRREEIRALACIAITGANSDAERAITAGTANAETFISEISLQHLALAGEYVEVLGYYMDRPEVDWMKASGVVMSTSMGQPDTAGTFVGFFADLLEEALFWSDPSSYG